MVCWIGQLWKVPSVYVYTTHTHTPRTKELSLFSVVFACHTHTHTRNNSKSLKHFNYIACTTQCIAEIDGLSANDLLTSQIDSKLRMRNAFGGHGKRLCTICLRQIRYGTQYRVKVSGRGNASLAFEKINFHQRCHTNFPHSGKKAAAVAAAEAVKREPMKNLSHFYVKLYH